MRIFGAVIAALCINAFLAPKPVKLQAYLPGDADASSWLQTNCRGTGRDIDKCKATAAALEGSGADALKLAAGIAPDNLSGRLYWLHIAAQNGSTEGMRRLAQALAKLPDKQYGRVHRIRARFWLERAAQAGDTEIVDLIRELSPVSETEAVTHRVPDATNPNPELTCSPMPWWRFLAVLWGDVDPRMSEDYLTCEDIPRFEQYALRGNTEWITSARKLGFFLTISQQDQGRAEGIYWERIGAENGDTLSKYNFGVLYVSVGAHRGGNPDHRIRGRYWLRKAAAEGSELARIGLIDVNDLDLTTEWFEQEP